MRPAATVTSNGIASTIAEARGKCDDCARSPILKPTISDSLSVETLEYSGPRMDSPTSRTKKTSFRALCALAICAIVPPVRAHFLVNPDCAGSVSTELQSAGTCKIKRLNLVLLARPFTCRANPPAEAAKEANRGGTQ